MVSSPLYFKLIICAFMAEIDRMLLLLSLFGNISLTEQKLKLKGKCQNVQLIVYL